MKLILKGLAALTVLTMLTCSSSAEWWDKCPPPKARNGQAMPALWWEWVKGGSRLYGSNPFLISALMDIEANGWRIGRLGNSLYIGPCGFNPECNLPREVIYNPEEQIRRACYLLAGDPRPRLKRYNPKWHENNYLGDVLARTRELTRQAQKSYVREK